MDHSTIKKAIIKSQHCQRNWDLTQSIPQEDLDLLVHAVTQCPSKQNIAFYKAHFIQDRDLIEQIHEFTRHNSRHPDYETETNSQILANLVVVFERNNFVPSLSGDIYRSEETELIIKGQKTAAEISVLQRDAEMAVGIAAGYLNLTAGMLGYSTGCCACFQEPEVKKLLNLEQDPILLMGVGFKNPDVNRRIHHQLPDFVFSTKIKQPIPITFR
jgi:nitroreductase